MRGYLALVLAINAALIGCAGRGGSAPENTSEANNPASLGAQSGARRIVPLVDRSGPETWLTSPDNVVPTARAVQARKAYDMSVYGRGVVVAVVDSGVDADHPAFGGRVLAGRNTVANSDDVRDGARNGLGHGTHVAGTIAGQAVPELNLFEQVGVAPATHILPVRVTNDDGSFPSNLGEQQTAIVDGLVWASQHAHVINMSIGNEGAKLADKNASCSGNLAQAGQASAWMCAANAVVANGSVWVVAAGNNGQSANAGVGYQGFGTWAANSALNGQMLVVGSAVPRYAFTSTGAAALDSGGDLVVKSWDMSKFSDVPGDDVEKQKWFLVAPGEGVRSATANSYGTAPFNEDSGTSMAAPLVSGAAALLLEKWSFLPASQVVDILLRSASDLGEPGMDPVFGRGLLNIAGAMSPLGALRIPAGLTVSGEAVAADSALTAPAATGNALERAVALNRVMAMDEYDRDFYVDLTINVVRAKPVLRVQPIERAAPATLGRFDGRNWSVQTTLWAPQRVLEWSEPAVGLLGGSQSALPFLGGRPLAGASFATQGMRLSTLSSVNGQEVVWTGFAAERLSQSSVGKFRLYGAYLRDNGLFGAEGSGAWALGKTHTAAAGFGWRTDLGSGFMLDANLHAGVTGLIQPGELFTGGNLLARANSLGMVWQGRDQTSGVNWQQPLRVERGRLRASIPVARTVAGRVARKNIDIDLTPDGQENTIELFWQGDIGRDSSLRLNVAWRSQPNHVRSAETLAMTGLAWESRW